jgi:hypothetical protein
MIRKKFKVPIYFGYLEVYVSDDWKATSDKYNLKITDKYVNGYDGLADGITYKNGLNRYWIIVTPKTSVSTLAHESVHIASFIFLNAGVIADYNNDEPYAYMVGWIFNKVYKTFNLINNGKTN